MAPKLESIVGTRIAIKMNQIHLFKKGEKNGPISILYPAMA